MLYTHDHNPVGNPATWGDSCPTPPGPTTDGCTVTGNLSRVPVDPATGAATGPEQPLITGDWCQQYPSHSIGHLAFGPDGNLYVTGGDGASFTNTDWGQFGGSAGSPTPANPCGDPPSAVGTPLSPPGAEGGALRSQSPRRVAGHPILLDGAVLRVDPATGNGVAGNPMYDAQNPSSNASRIIGHGLRNPFRFTFRPGTSELWVGDVGWNTWEEVNRIISSTPANPVNFGWPCYEGAGRLLSYDSANLTICENLYTDTIRPAIGPHDAYNHSASVVSGDGCPTNQGSVISAISFYAGGSYPGTYNGALFSPRGCSNDATVRAATGRQARTAADLAAGPRRAAASPPTSLLLWSWVPCQGGRSSSRHCYGPKGRPGEAHPGRAPARSSIPAGCWPASASPASRSSSVVAAGESSTAAEPGHRAGSFEDA